jgi:antitoxin (DNA-binding transcriptional repressor) of toxin-antitoxin stability system
MTATEAARTSSGVLNRVAAGEEIEVIRSGAPVAVISRPRARLLTAERFRTLVQSAPRPNSGFAADVRAARETLEPPDVVWPS